MVSLSTQFFQTSSTEIQHIHPGHEHAQGYDTASGLHYVNTITRPGWQTPWTHGIYAGKVCKPINALVAFCPYHVHDPSFVFLQLFSFCFSLVRFLVNLVFFTKYVIPVCVKLLSIAGSIDTALASIMMITVYGVCFFTVCSIAYHVLISPCRCKIFLAHTSPAGPPHNR